MSRTENKTAQLITDLTTGSVLRRLMYLTLPLMASVALQVCYNLVDMVFVGQFAGTNDLSAVSIGGQLPTTLMRICVGLCTGGQIYIAQQVGAGDRESLRPIIGNLLTLNFIAGTFFTLVCTVFARPLLVWQNTPVQAMEETLSYFRILSGATLLTFGYNALGTILRGMGDGKRPMIFVAVASVANILLDYLFVGVFRLGAAGAAWATVLGQALAFGYALVYLIRRKEEFGFDFKLSSFRLEKRRAGIILKLGIPVAVQNTVIGMSLLFVNIQINALGVVAVTVAGIGSKLQNIVNVVGEALVISVATLTGQNMGAGKPRRVKETVWLSWGLTMVFLAVVAAVFLLFPREIFGLFSRDAQVLSYARPILVSCLVIMLANCLMAPCLGLISGVGFTSLNMAIGILDGVVGRICLAVVLGRVLELGVIGYFLGNGLAGFVSAIAGSIYFFSGAWQRRRLVEEAGK